MPRHKQFDPDEAMQEAMEAFWEHGYNATSVNDLLAEMGLNRGSLYGTFGDKKQLFLAALDKYDEQNGAPIQDVLNQSGSARKALRDLVNLAAAHALGECRGRGCLAAKAAMELAPHDKDVAAWLKKFHRRNEQMVAKVVERGQAEGEIPADLEPRATARFLLNSMGGLRVLGTMSPSAGEVREVVDMILKVIER